MSEIVKKWYVLRAVSGKEAKVKEYLEADLRNGNLSSDLVSQVLIPTEKVAYLKNGKKSNEGKKLSSWLRSRGSSFNW
jgi:transcriptional antiterminator NusG